MFSQTPIFEQTAAFLGTPGVHRAPLHGVVAPRDAVDAPATAESADPAAFPGATDVYGVTQPVEAVWSPAADGAPGIFADPAGRRRIRVRWLAVGAGLLLTAFLVVGAVGLLGGPKAPVLPWTSPHAQPQPSSAIATQHQRSSAHRGAATPRPHPTQRVLAGQQAPHPSVTPQASSASMTAPARHTPPGLANKPLSHPVKSHP